MVRGALEQTMHSRIEQKRIWLLILLAVFCGGAIVYVWVARHESDLSWAKSRVDLSVFIGKPRSEIDSVLGLPDDPDGYFAAWDHAYWLGPDSSYLDNMWLVVKVDESGVVEHARIVSD